MFKPGKENFRIVPKPKVEAKKNAAPVKRATRSLKPAKADKPKATVQEEKTRQKESDGSDLDNERERIRLQAVAKDIARALANEEAEQQNKRGKTDTKSTTVGRKAKDTEANSKGQASKSKGHSQGDEKHVGKNRGAKKGFGKKWGV